MVVINRLMQSSVVLQHSSQILMSFMNPALVYEGAPFFPVRPGASSLDWSIFEHSCECWQI